MSYTTEVRHEGAYLHCRITGQNTAEAIRGYLAEIPLLCEQHGVRNVLIEEDLAGPSLPLFDIFHIVAEASRAAWPRVRHVAFVDVNPEHDPENMRFAETVAVNRGVNVRRFATLDEAAAWLRKLDTQQDTQT